MAGVRTGEATGAVATAMLMGVVDRAGMGRDRNGTARPVAAIASLGRQHPRVEDMAADTPAAAREGIAEVVDTVAADLVVTVVAADPGADPPAVDTRAVAADTVAVAVPEATVDKK